MIARRRSATDTRRNGARMHETSIRSLSASTAS
jgi:hypothetical protein